MVQAAIHYSPGTNTPTGDLTSFGARYLQNTAEDYLYHVKLDENSFRLVTNLILKTR